VKKLLFVFVYRYQVVCRSGSKDTCQVITRVPSSRILFPRPGSGRASIYRIREPFVS